MTVMIATGKQNRLFYGWMDGWIDRFNNQSVNLRLMVVNHYYSIEIQSINQVTKQQAVFTNQQISQ